MSKCTFFNCDVKMMNRNKNAIFFLLPCSRCVCVTITSYRNSSNWSSEFDWGVYSLYLYSYNVWSHCLLDNSSFYQQITYLIFWTLWIVKWFLQSVYICYFPSIYCLVVLCYVFPVFYVCYELGNVLKACSWQYLLYDFARILMSLADIPPGYSPNLHVTSYITSAEFVDI